MTPMILYCSTCSSQNFVSAERGAVGGIPPRCWKCGEPLPAGDESGSGGGESNTGTKKANTAGSGENA
jgi:hypothetical protein